MDDFSPNTNLNDARKLRAASLLAAGLLLLISFGLLTEAVLQRKAFYEWDVICKDELHRHALTHETTRTLFLRLTDLASRPALFVETIAVLIALLFAWHRRLGAIWLALTFGGFKLIELLKDYYARPRPKFLEPILQEASTSIPSAHTAAATIVFGMLAYLLIRFTRRAGPYLAAACGLLILAIGFSRVYLGAHWLSDVVAGWLLGAGLVALAMAAAESSRER